MAGGILSGLRIVEGSAFIAAPLCGLTLAQLGADVIRFDQIGGGMDYRRWPVNEAGTSLYWTGLNKAKRSVALDLRSPEGREIAIGLVTAGGEEGGIFVTNYPETGWLGYEALSSRRADLIHLNITGGTDGSSAVDYTVNSAVGYPFVTGEANADHPVNHVMPAWDVATGFLAAAGLLAAERQRRLTGAGQRVRLPLADTAYATVGNLGHIAETMLSPEPRKAYGNYLYGAFGRDFGTSDGRRVMVVAITTRQWTSLVKTVGIAAETEAIEARTGLALDKEGDRFEAREEIAALVEPWCAARSLGQVAEAFQAGGILWGPYRTFDQMLKEDPHCSAENPMFGWIDQPGVGRVLAPASPLSFAGHDRAPSPAPELGQHTDEVLSGVLGMPDAEIAALRDRGVVG